MKTEGVLEKRKEQGEVNKKDNSNLTRTIILGLVGFVLLLLPETLSKLIGIVVGAAGLVVGLISIYKYMQNSEGNGLALASGILYSVLGVFIMLYPHSIIRLVAICLGVFLFLSGIIKIRNAIMVRQTNTKWRGTLIIGFVTLVLGSLLVFNPFSGIAITKLAGAFLVTVSVFDVIDTYILQK